MVLTEVKQRPKNYPLFKIKAPDVLSDRTKVTGGQFKEIPVSSTVHTLEKVLEQLVPGIYGYDIAVDETVMDNICKVVPECLAFRHPNK